jgi:serine/threonine-protein kinase
VAVLRAVQESVIAPPDRLNPDVPHDLSEIVMKALARVPDERFQRAFDLERALANFVLQHAQSMDDTAVGPFLQAVFHEQFEPQPEPPRDVPAGDDFGVGSTHFADRKPVEPEMTLTGTPIRPVPAHATPKPTLPERVGLADVDPQARKTTQVGALPAEPPAPRPTEQQPARRPGPTSRRFDPLPTVDRSAVVDTNTLDPAKPAAPEPASAAKKSALPMVLGGLVAVGVLVGLGVVAFGASNEPAPPLPASVTTPTPIAPKSVVAEPPAPEPVAEPRPTPAFAPAVADAGVVEVADAGLAPPAAVAVKPDKPADPVKPKPGAAVRALGSLRVTDAIPFAMVTIDGARSAIEAQGSKVISLPAGTHEVEISFKGKKRKQTVLIKATETVSLSAGEE